MTKEVTFSDYKVEAKNALKRYSKTATAKYQIALTKLYEHAEGLDYEKAKKGKEALDEMFPKKV